MDSRIPFKIVSFAEDSRMKTLRTHEVEISTVTPMRNELPCVREFVRRVDAALQALGGDYEIIVVNDGSTDGTGELLEELTAEFPQLRPVHLNRSFGQATATDAGFQQSCGRYVVMLDGDLEQPPEEIPKLITEARRGFDLVSGRRTKRDINFMLRAIPSRVANWLLRSTTGCQVRDMGGIKCLRGEIARSLHLRSGHHRFLPALVHVLGGKVSEVPVETQPRFAGQSHYGIGRTVDVFLDIANFWFQTGGKGRPVYFFGRISMLLMAAAALMSLGLVANLIMGSSAATWPLIGMTLGAGLAAAGFLSLGVGLELVKETHTALIDHRDLKLTTVRSEPAESESLASQRHAA